MQYKLVSNQHSIFSSFPFATEPQSCSKRQSFSTVSPPTSSNWVSTVQSLVHSRCTSALWHHCLCSATFTGLDMLREQASTSVTEYQSRGPSCRWQHRWAAFRSATPMELAFRMENSLASALCASATVIIFTTSVVLRPVVSPWNELESKWPRHPFWILLATPCQSSLRQPNYSLPLHSQPSQYRSQRKLPRMPRALCTCLPSLL
mmetsp:Transcript_3427/g.9891  ORF Transcript_3427/g.9891 Transcript_3427/m.9891 type:complete len:205 (-) Transcript_3427:5208-5822(-)